MCADRLLHIMNNSLTFDVVATKGGSTDRFNQNLAG